MLVRVLGKLVGKLWGKLLARCLHEQDVTLRACGQCPAVVLRAC